MTDGPTHDTNAEFLAASVGWLRLLLRHHAPPTAPQAATPTPVAEQARGRFGRDRHTPATRVRPGTLALAAGDPRPDIAAAAQTVEAAAAASPTPALVALATRLHLTRFERDVLMFCAAAELDTGIGALCAAAQGDDHRAYPTFALALAVLPDGEWAALSPDGPLRYWRLLELAPAGSLVSSPLRIDERVLHHIKGLDQLDARLAPLLTRLPLPADGLAPSQEATVDAAAALWQQPATTAALQLVGSDEQSRELVAAALADRFELPALRMPADVLPSAAADQEDLARLWRRETTLSPAVLCLDAQAGSAGEQAPIAAFLARLDVPVLVSAPESVSGPGVHAAVLDVEAPTRAERAAAWRTSLGADADDATVAALADRFTLSIPAINDLASVGEDAAWSASVARSRPRLDGLAERVAPAAGWDDLVLPPDAERMLHQIADQATNRGTVHDTWGFAVPSPRGLGLSVLLYGPSGSGKTLCAEVLAHELRVDLYRVDLSGVVSKYIGETEKNLRRLFDAAEAGGALLFLDEADALLGKRSEVREAHDRYANIQIDYLLQRMESFRGLAIMATNMRAAIDPAFLRRLRFVVEIPFPAPAQRRALWQRSFPLDAPGRADLDWDRLGRLPVTGGMTRNIALNAAFLAAAAGSSITMPLVLSAARDEFRKLELPVREHDFAWAVPA